MSDGALATASTWLQWTAIGGVVLTLITGVGLIFVRKELTARQEDRLAKAHADAVSARQEAEVARTRGEAAHRRAEVLEEKLRPRHLTNAQRESLTRLLRGVPKGPLTLLFVKLDPEAASFAAELSGALSSAGFRIETYPGPLLLTLKPGVWFGMRSDESAASHPHAAPLLRVMKEAGIRCEGILDPSLPGEVLYLAVGPKTEP